MLFDSLQNFPGVPPSNAGLRPAMERFAPNKRALRVCSLDLNKNATQHPLTRKAGNATVQKSYYYYLTMDHSLLLRETL